MKIKNQLVSPVIPALIILFGISGCTKDQPPVAPAERSSVSTADPQAVAQSIATAKTGPAIQGTIKIEPALKDKLSATAVLYIIARPDGVTAGPPAAVKRFPSPIQFPVSFSISKADAMFPDTSFEGKFRITARVSQSGSATPVNPGDLQAAAPSQPVSAGDKSIEIVLNEVKK